MNVQTQLHADNHFVPRFYLKAWANGDNKIEVYRILVSHRNVPEWTSRSVSNVAYHKHLYSRMILSGKTDDFEKWIESAFETPASAVIRKAISGLAMSREDWNALARFVAAQDLRTPARYFDSVTRFQEYDGDAMLREIINDAKRDGVQLQDLVEGGVSTPDGFPCTIRIVSDTTRKKQIAMKITHGRAFWQYAMRRSLQEIGRIMEGHRWTILRAPNGLEWPTSDTPLVRLNFRSLTEYNLAGGWGVPHTSLMMPLSPRHLLITEVAAKHVPQKYTVAPDWQAAFFIKCIAENAHRSIFSREPIPKVALYRPRTIDQDRYAEEERFWKNWDHEQSVIEQEYFCNA